MANLAQMIEREAGDETIISAVIGKHYDSKWSETPASSYMGKVLPWPEARSILDYEYNSGFGGADCHPVFAWTESKVLFVSEYDGATEILWVPRHPSPIIPDFSGKPGKEL